MRTRPEASLGPVFADVLRLLRRDFYARAQGLDLTPALARLLFYVAREPLSRQIDLAVRLEITPVTLGRMVDRLVALGYVERRSDLTDRRAFRLQVTAQAKPFVARLEAIAAATRARALDGLTALERKQLMRLLDRVRDNLDGGH